MRFDGGEGADALERLCVLEGFQRAFGAFQDGGGHAGHAGDVDTEAVGRATFLDLAEEKARPKLYLFSGKQCNQQ